MNKSNSTTNSETHLIIIWSNALYIKERILDDLVSKFDVLDVCEVAWKKEYFSRNLSRFYGEKLPYPSFYKRWYSGNFISNSSYKERQCGSGPFLSIIIRDKHPKYGDRETTKGIKNVNSNIFNLKLKYREWAGGGHLIHTTNDIIEARHDLVLLFGKSYDQINNTYQKKWDGIIRYYNKDLVGNTNWENLEELFLVLNETSRYVILRNFENYPDSFINETHSDVDVLTDNYREILLITNAILIYRNQKRIGHNIAIGKKLINFDFRYVGDGYYDKNWQENILKTRVEHENIYIPSKSNLYFSLLYHALIHKRYLSLDYFHRLIQISQKLLTNDKNKLSSLIQILNNYLLDNSYEVTEPTDYSVYYNDFLCENKKLSWERNIYWGVVNLKKYFKDKLSGGLKDYLLPYYSKFIENYHSIKWLIKDCNIFKENLYIKKGIHNLQIFSFFSWHNGAYYFLGRFEQRKVFIKTDYFFRLLINEINIYNYFESIDSINNFYPKVITDVIDENNIHDFIVYEYIDGVTLDKIDFSKMTLKNKNKIFGQLLYLVLELRKYKIIHRDIKPQNILITGINNDEVKLIDWMFSVSMDSSLIMKELSLEGINKIIIKNLGEKYRKGNLCWDDAYSMMKVFDGIKASGEDVDSYIFELSLMVDTFEYSLQSSY